MRGVKVADANADEAKKGAAPVAQAPDDDNIPWHFYAHANNGLTPRDKHFAHMRVVRAQLGVKSDDQIISRAKADAAFAVLRGE